MSVQRDESLVPGLREEFRKTYLEVQKRQFYSDLRKALRGLKEFRDTKGRLVISRRKHR